MEIRFNIEKADVLAVISSRPRAWRTFVFVLVLGVMFLMGIYVIDHGLAAAGWSWLVLTFALAIGAYEWPRIRVRRELRHNPTALGETRFVITDEGVTMVFPTGKADMQWGAFTKFTETSDSFLLHYSPSHYTFIPKRALEREQVSEVRRLLSQHVPAS